jgi:hypothetical protein
MPAIAEKLATDDVTIDAPHATAEELAALAALAAAAPKRRAIVQIPLDPTAAPDPKPAHASAEARA